MNVELFPFQQIAVKELRKKVADALNFYRTSHTQQVVSLQAPTGAGKTIIMAAFIEDVIYGTEDIEEQPNAIFVWLSDSPQLNEQSKNKFLKSDKISVSQCITISEESFDKETFDDGKIYFLNTQKIGKSGNLSKQGDNRQYTIWQTIENTAKQKSDRLYFIIDEAHRGMQGMEAGKATTIMQRFLKGAPDLGLSAPVPLVVGISATASRFNKLVEGINSTLHKVLVSPNDVRSSGLLKDRIVITYPNDAQKNNEMAVLDAATDEWMNKVKHWYQYCKEQHYAYVNPIMVVQVKAGSGDKVSETNLDDVIAKIEEKTGMRFKPFEVVHTFGDQTMLTINGLKVHHIEPNDIVDDRRIKIVFFKENLSTGWDCPRAETMVSFRHAEDVTYIAQLLGRMIRTPLQSHIKVDDSLNDVRLYLPYFNRDNVEAVVNELQESECGEIPTYVDSESIDNPVRKVYTIRVAHKKSSEEDNKNQPSLFSDFFDDGDTEASKATGLPIQTETTYTQVTPVVSPVNYEPETTSSSKQQEPKKIENNSVEAKVPGPTLFTLDFDRPAICKYINDLGLLNYMVRSVKINSYLKSLTALAALLTHNDIDRSAMAVITKDIVEMIHNHAEELHKTGAYDKLAKEILTYKLAIKIFDVFGQDLNNGQINDALIMSNSELDRQVRVVDAKLANFGFPQAYGHQYYDPDNPDAFKLDCILFALDDNSMAAVNNYAEKKFHELNDANRKYIVAKTEQLQKQYSDIIADGDIVSKHNFSLPEEILVPEDPSGKEYLNHLFADEKTGKAIIKLNTWEEGVIEEEQNKPDFVCWLRNPSRASWSLTIPYEINGETKPAYPDFLIIRRDDKLGYVIDILEPHNPDFKDNLPKAKGFARYAESEFKIGRIQLIRKAKDAAGKDKFKRLDFSSGEIRNLVLKMQTSDELDHLFDTKGFFEN